MDKTSNSITKIGKYLREISVVVIGIAITLSLNFWINNSNERKNLAIYLNSIIIEMERNAESFDYFANAFQKSAGYARYIQSHNEKSISMDSIVYYAHSSDGFGWGVIFRWYDNVRIRQKQLEKHYQC
jgi:hypothetical protein